MIDVLIGLLVVYFLFSMVVTGLVELGSAYMALRAATLKKAVEAMLVSAAPGPGTIAAGRRAQTPPYCEPCPSGNRHG
ncbi:MAG: hypothetical protein HC888_13460 [Candidatus Competibacteraceae bacterium]|nr:hypothetical protein [Candidatus Competibacteraceae bacterium]